MVNKKKAAGASSATHQQNTVSNDNTSTNTNTNNDDSTAQKIIEHLELMNERNQKEMRNLMESFEDRFMHKFNEINERINQQEKINTEKLDDGLNRMIEMKKEEQEGFNMMNGGLEDGQAAHSLPHEFLEHLKGILHDFVVHEINGPITENIIMTKRMLNMMEGGGGDDRYNSNNNNTMKQGPPGDNDSIGMPPSPPHGGGGGPPGPNNGGNPNNRPPFSDHDDYGVVNNAPPRGRNDEPPQFRQQQQHPPPQQIIHPDNHRRMRSNSVDSQRSYYSDRGDNRGGRDGGFNNRNFNNNMNNNSFNHQGPPQNLYQGERGDSDINDRLSMSDGGGGGRGGPPERLESLGSNNNNNNIGGGGPGPGARFMMNERHGGYPNAQNPRELPSYVLTQRFTIGDLLDGKKRKGLQIPRVSNGRTNICLKYHCLQSGCKHGDNCDYVDSHRRLNSDEQARLERFVKDCLTDDGFNSMDGSGHGGGGAHYNRGGGGGRGGPHPFNRGGGGGPPHRDNSFGGQGGGGGAGQGGPRDDDSYNNNNNNHNNGNFHHHPNNRNKGNSWANNNNNAGGGGANENFNNGNRRTPLKWSPPEDGIKRRRMNYD